MAAEALVEDKTAEIRATFAQFPYLIISIIRRADVGTGAGSAVRARLWAFKFGRHARSRLGRFILLYIMHACIKPGSPCHCVACMRMCTAPGNTYML